MISSKVQVWISACRPHTLPLAVSGIIIGNLAAFHQSFFSWPVLLLATLTAVLFQIISNLANDFGDHKHGADNEDRKGPDRMLQTGQITAGLMKRAIIITSLLALASATILLIISFDVIGWTGLFVLFTLGILSIIAAIAYTASPNPYGYRGLGDPAVFLFFGLLAVMGSYFLQTGKIDDFIMLPAFAVGFFSTSVLNINNMRDLDNDKEAGKMTIAVKLGKDQVKVYHTILNGSGILAYILFLDAYFSLEWLLAAIFILPVVYNIIKVWKAESPEDLDPCLKQMVMATAVFTAGMAVVLLV